MCVNASKNVLSIATVALNALSAALKIIAPNDPNLVKYEQDAQTLLTQLANWTPQSTATGTILEIISIVEADINLLPIPPQYQALVGIALAGLSSIISLIEMNSTAGGPTQAAAFKALNVSSSAEIPDPAYSGRWAAVRYTRDWNTWVEKFPELKAAHITQHEMLKELLN